MGRSKRSESAVSGASSSTINSKKTFADFFGNDKKRAKFDIAEASTASGSGQSAGDIASANSVAAPSAASPPPPASVAPSEPAASIPATQGYPIAPSEAAASIPAGQGSPATQGMNKNEMMASIEAGNCTGLMENVVGLRLTEENLHKFQSELAKTGTAFLEGDKTEAGDEGDSLDGLMPADRKFAESLKSVIESDNFGTKNALGNKFRQAHMKGTSTGDAYHALQSRAEGAAFRLSWAKDQFKNITQQKVHQTSWKRVDRTKGRYRPVGRLIADFGGFDSPEAVEGAANAVNKCLMMGAPWVVRHPQSNLLEYLVLEMEFEEEFSNMWSHFKKSWETKALGDAGDEKPGAISGSVDGGKSSGKVDEAKQTADPDKKETDKSNRGGNKNKGGKESDGNTKGGKDTGGNNKGGKAAGRSPSEKGGDDDDDDPKKRLVKLFRDAAIVKIKFHSASSSFVQMACAIDSDPSWGWAKGGVQHQKLVSAQESLKGALNDWHREFVCSSDATGVKKKYSAERCTVELNKFIAAKPLVDKLAAILCSTNRAHEELQNS
jgi:hypothetical protein